jgi:hypothetical protein
VAGDHVYFAAGPVYTVPKLGGSAQELPVHAGHWTGSMAVAAGRLFVPIAPTADTVVALPLNGDPPHAVWSYRWWGAGGNQQGDPLPTWVTASANDVVIVGGGDDEDTSHDGVIARLDAVTEEAHGLADSLRHVGAPFVLGQTVFFALEDDGVFTVPLAGGAVTRVSACAGWCAPARGIVVDEATIYVWLGAIYSVSRTTGAATTLADAAASDLPRATLVGDACALYWVSPQGVMRMRKPL